MSKQQIGKLALREEGGNWNAYFVGPETTFLGSINMNVVANNPARKQAFQDLMQDALGDVIEQVAGVRPTWDDPVPAPESERAGNG